MKDNETKERFLELRAKGLPLAKIAAEIKVSKTGDQSAKVQIRVGFFGDEALSLTVLDKIKTNL